MMTRRYYSRESPEFAAALEEAPTMFHPRFHLFYTEREAEQDAYYWFRRGVKAELVESLSIVGQAVTQTDDAHDN
jgi:hypothetical protein